MVVANEEENLKELLPLVHPFVDEIVVVNQGSTDGTELVCKEYGAKVFTKTRKFLADIDRNMCYLSASGDWIFGLDADERPTPELLVKLKILASANNVDCYWFKFDNKVDGVDINDILGKESHPRLWRKGAVDWPERAHTWPQVKSNRQCFLDYKIKHHRTLERIEKVHASRKQAIDPQNQQIEDRFLQMVREKLTVMRKNNGNGT